ncbi:MAG: o-succinylbenzoate synthase [Actinobacteria bacterium]|nr:o-succinylbenzoate synthase [Actinomycetota bacterium]
MRIERVDLLQLQLRLRHPFVTSFGPQHERHVVLVRVHADGVDGWGELVAGRNPVYSEETVATALTVIRDHLLVLTLGRRVDDPRQPASWWRKIRGNPMAKAAVEMAVWDAWSAATATPLAALLGGSRTAVPAGVSIGIQDSTSALLDRVEQFLERGYVRIKLKIAPGSDVTPVAAVRERFGDVALMADANSAYTLDDAEHLAQLDAFELTMIEQPLAHDDIIDHASLAPRVRTPLCLDESVRSADDARRALHIGACRIINCKPGRLGGLSESLALHDWAVDAGVPLWVGGMLETGVGRLHNIALASLPGFTLPGDTSASDRYWHTDIIEPAVTIAADGTVAVPTVAGVDAVLDHERLQSLVTHRASFTAS